MEKREYIVVGTIDITSDDVYEYLAYRNKTNSSELKETYEPTEQDWKDCAEDFYHNGYTEVHDFVRKKD